MDEKTLQGQTALVTGATSGIGRAAANALAADGATVIVHGRDAARGDEVVEELRAAGASARFLAAELGDTDQVRELAAAAGEVDILVNNVGIFEIKDAFDIPDADWVRLFETNVLGVVGTTMAAIPTLRANRPAVVCNVTSSSILASVPFYSAYRATKAAVSAFGDGFL